VHRVQGCAAQLAPSPLFLPRRAPVGDVLTGELPQKLRHPIEVGKSLPAPWLLQRWGQGDRWCFLSHWPRRTAARAQPACGNGAGAAALADSMVRVGVTMLQRACWAGREVLQGLRWLWPRRRLASAMAEVWWWSGARGQVTAAGYRRLGLRGCSPDIMAVLRLCPSPARQPGA